MSRKDLIYKLLDDLGGEETGSQFVLAELISWLNGDTIEEFVDDFRRHHSMVDDDEEDGEN